ncbi:cytochrome d ubiquinol oxidase subunit II [Duganella aceris]|uniref:Cytochrome d ubiquinol oxidase subunit II n=1 Tax=Duganella aceris TaxID=2703883 RepID=A0ABX0FBP7_9BURK|nr:cytochrome d ubiquinol oxidase subunit II [Duganella aceris]NGZ82772.1 cytochrome d ubiquinol oxidase subunit II [Duganella aceris]
MDVLLVRLAALDAWCARRTAFLNHPRAGLVAAVLAPLLLGLVSLASGQDDGWDMRNYHLYNVYALLNGRIGFDLAPGAFQSYFNPTLELPYYLLNRCLPPRLAGFCMGALHGLNFVLLAALARRLCGDRRVALLLAGAGMFTPGFLSELGNTMGDNLTALPVLGALLMLVHHWDAMRRPGAAAALAALGGGLLMGAASGLKLTNAVYAVAMCLALLAIPLAPWRRLWLAFVFGVGVLGGIALTAGWWFLKMWQVFGNPLFPQFNNLFHSPLAPEAGVIASIFLPRGLLENLLWPFVFALDPVRVGELPMKLALWPVMYLLGALFIAMRLRRRTAGTDARGGLVLLFTGIGYLVWMRLFSIQRYLVPLELIAPLVIWLLWHGVVASAPLARRLAGVSVALLALSVFPVANWGHAPWADRNVEAQVPAMAAPASSVIFIAHLHPPMGWMAMFMPPQARVVRLGGMPESPGYLQRLRDVIAERPGPHYVMLASSKNEKLAALQRKLSAARALGLTDDAAGCGKLAWLMRHIRFQATLRGLPSGGCTLDLPPQHQLDLAALDREIVRTAGRDMARFGLGVDAASCVVYQAAVGKEPYPYQWCRVTRAPD